MSLDRDTLPDALTAVRISTPAEAPYLSLLRVVTANIMARMDFNLDEIEDTRIGVSEATAILLEQATPGSEIDCVFTSGSDHVAVELSVRNPLAKEPSPDSFAWVVLSTLLEEVSAKVEDDVLSLRLVKHRGVV